MIRSFGDLIRIWCLNTTFLIIHIWPLYGVCESCVARRAHDFYKSNNMANYPSTKQSAKSKRGHSLTVSHTLFIIICVMINCPFFFANRSTQNDHNKWREFLHFASYLWIGHLFRLATSLLDQISFYGNMRQKRNKKHTHFMWRSLFICANLATLTVNSKVKQRNSDSREQTILTQ